MRNVLAAASTDVGKQGFDNQFGYGVINVDRALREIEGYNLSAQVFPEKTWVQKLKEKVKWK